MNSEELEVSLRTEFEQYLSGVRAEMKQRLADFQQKVDGEFEKHKSQIDEAIHDFSRHIESENAMGDILKESVVEHLRLARDDGARLAASAAAEAEMLGHDPASGGGFDLIRDAIAEISSRTSQSAILKSLIEYSANFTARGAFFIIKNEQFIGWQVFGDQAFADSDAVREIKFAVSADTILGNAVRELVTTRASFGAHSDDKKFLDVLKLGRPANMVAIPLIARGRGVAVLYADPGEDNGPLNIDALETLVRVAGLTVELLASSQYVPQPEPRAAASSRPPKRAAKQPENESVKEQKAEAPVEKPVEAAVEPVAAPEQEAPAEAAFSEAAPVDPEVIPVEVESTLDDEAYLMTEEPVEEVAVAGEAFVEPIPVEENRTDFAFAPAEVIDPTIQHVDVEYTNGSSGSNGHSNGKHETVAPAVEAAAPERRTSRRMDLPIEVAEDERRLHTDARRFARLLVSEIKLYNEQQVNEGRESKDLYDRLRDSIERSREMYNKRVKPPVAEKFDYFHYELVSGLAEGEEARLGNNYPGSAA